MQANDGKPITNPGWKSLGSVSKHAICLAVMGLVCGVGSAEAQASLLLSFDKIADTTTAVPGRPGSTFQEFGFVSPIADGTVAFRGTFSAPSDPPSEFSGIFAGDGGTPITIADFDTPVPGRPEVSFNSFGHPAIDGGVVAFSADIFDTGPAWPPITSGVYVGSGGPLTTIAEGDSGFTAPAISDGTVAFHRGFILSDDGGIYTGQGGPLTTIADADTPVPGRPGASFTVFGISEIDDDMVAFSSLFDDGASPLAGGVYRSEGGALITIADTDTPVPGRPGTTFDMSPLNPSPIAISGDTVAFRGDFDGVFGQGIYTGDGGPLATVVDVDTPVPGRPGTSFDHFGSPAIEGDLVAFVGFLPQEDSLLFPFDVGLFLAIGGGIEPILFTGDELDGKIVDFIVFGRLGLDGNQLAFWVTFQDDPSLPSEVLNQAIYRVTFTPQPASAPASLALLLPGLWVLVRQHARARRAAVEPVVGRA